MKELPACNANEHIYSTIKRITLWRYALGIGFGSSKKDNSKTVTFIVEKKYSVDGINHLKRTGYALQHIVCGKNNRISVHKRTQILKGT
ncbi:hypothetical protein [Sphingobacterium athyrii]|uniref:Uncharacterized protein n=1 Tax=Sphingobacterium athyrii TaxID=2152717 RepID=A0A363NUE5_9SPHI|nr:hypothetical protein [Sphingobacterium athyrii]PUV24399.1 hypothetical protein DCO56_13725 [Sphingobacterium athyrii]